MECSFQVGAFYQNRLIYDTVFVMRSQRCGKIQPLFLHIQLLKSDLELYILNYNAMKELGAIEYHIRHKPQGQDERASMSIQMAHNGGWAWGSAAPAPQQGSERYRVPGTNVGIVFNSAGY